MKLAHLVVSIIMKLPNNALWLSGVDIRTDPQDHLLLEDSNLTIDR